MTVASLQPSTRRAPKTAPLLILVVVAIGLVAYQQYSLLFYNAMSSTALLEVGILPTPSQQLQQSEVSQLVTVNLTNNKNPPTIYHCGDNFGGFPEYSFLMSSVFPEYKWINVQEKINKKVEDRMKRFKLKRRPSVNYRPMTRSYDIFLNHWDNACSIIAYRFVWQFFDGKTVFVYPEAHTGTRPTEHEHFFELGPMETRKNHMQLMFMQVCFWTNLSEDDKNRLFYKRPRGSKQNFLIYAHSNCVKSREDAFSALSHIAPVHYGGRCDGSLGTNYGQVPTNASHAVNTVKLRNFHENTVFFSSYKFCLVMEHESAVGYITEKILNAFIAGCLPIYHGPTEIFQFFNSKAFVFYDPSSPEGGLDLVRKLNVDDKLYDAMMNEPILANAEETIRDHFSFGDEIGEGRMKERIRALLGLNSVRFVT